MPFKIAKVELKKVLSKNEDLSLGLQHLRKSMAWLPAAVTPLLRGGDRWVQEHAGHPCFFPLASKLINVGSTLRRLKSVLKNFPQSKIL